MDERIVGGERQNVIARASQAPLRRRLGSRASNLDGEARLINEPRLKYFEMIQATIARMSGFSASAKAFTATLTTAVATIAVSLDQPQITLLALPVAAVMAAVDAQYLRLERGYRWLFNAVREEKWEDRPTFSMDVEASPHDWFAAFLSWSILSFYGALGLIAAGVVYLSA